MDTAAYFRDYDNIQDSSTISARLTPTLYLVYCVLVLKGTRKFSLWTPPQNFEIMIISQTALRHVEILAVDTAAEFPPD